MLNLTSLPYTCLYSLSVSTEDVRFGPKVNQIGTKNLGVLKIIFPIHFVSANQIVPKIDLQKPQMVAARNVTQCWSDWQQMEKI